MRPLVPLALLIITVLATAQESTRPTNWRGTLTGEFIGDTSGASVTSFLVPTIKIGLKSRLDGTVSGLGGIPERTSPSESGAS